MNFVSRTLFRMMLVSALTLVATVVNAHGELQCRAWPKSEWRPHTELHEKLVKEGWQVRRMEKTSTCYEVYGKDPKGNRVEAFFDPKTFAQMEEDFVEKK